MMIPLQKKGIHYTLEKMEVCNQGGRSSKKKKRRGRKEKRKNRKTLGKTPIQPNT